MIRSTAVLLLTLTILTLTCSLQAQNLVRSGFGKQHRSLVGFKAGVITASDFIIREKQTELTEVKLETKMGLSLQLFFDIPLGQKLMGGLTFEINDINVLGTRSPMLDLGINLKWPIYHEVSRIAWRPMIGFGYAYLGDVAEKNLLDQPLPISIDPLERTSYLTLRGGMELLFYGMKRHAYMLELMLYGAPWGGDNSWDVSFGPVVLLRVGVVY